MFSLTVHSRRNQTVPGGHCFPKFCSVLDSVLLHLDLLNSKISLFSRLPKHGINMLELIYTNFFVYGIFLSDVLHCITLCS